MLKRFFRRIGSFLKSVNHRHYVLIVVFLCLMGAIAIFYPQAYVRLYTAIKSLLMTYINVIKNMFNKNKDVVSPGVSIPDANNITVPESIKEIIYTFKTFSIYLFNADNFLNYLLDLSGNAIEGLKVLIFLPMFIGFGWIFMMFVIYRKDPYKKNYMFSDNETKNLKKYKNYENTRLYRAKNYFKNWQQFLTDNGKVYKIILVLIFMIFYRILPIAIDGLTAYINFAFTFNVNAILPLLSNLLVDALIVFLTYNKFFLVMGVLIVGRFLSFKRSKNKLSEMQENNEEYEESIDLHSLRTGAMGTFKTYTNASLAIDAEKRTRKQLLQQIKSANMMFPNFPWQKLEKYIVESLERKENINCAQFKRAMYRLVISHQETINANGNWQETEFFKLFEYNHLYNSFSFSNSIREIRLEEVLSNYAQSYFLYFTGKPLLFSNISVKVLHKKKGYFPIFDYNYLNMTKEEKEKNKQFCCIYNFNNSRLLMQYGAEKDDLGRFGFDRGVKLITEIGKERGNRTDYVGKKKDDFEANQTNDGHNMGVKLERHEYTINSKAIFKEFDDEQREGSINGDLVSLYERVSKNNETSETQSTLGFLGKIELSLAYFLTDLYVKHELKFREKRYTVTLYNYLLKKIAYLFFKRALSLEEYYGYRVSRLRDKKGDDEIIETKYYLLKQKMESETYATAGYEYFFEELRTTATAGFMDVPQYKGVLATTDEMEMQKSYLFNDMKIATTK